MEEVVASWRFIDPIIEGWKRNLVSLIQYQSDSDEVLSESQTINQHLHSLEIKREIGIVGLGKMGSSLSLNLIDKGWKVMGYNRTSEVTRNLEDQGIVGVYSFKEMIDKLSRPRIVWLMLTAGKPVDEVLLGDNALIAYLEEGDVVIDGGNSFYKDSVRRAKELEKRGISFVDVGFSGGPGGARRGACLMVGGKKQIYDRLLPLFLDISVPQGVQFFSGAGAGHFVKMVHNGIEYGIMQSIAEGFTILKKTEYNLNLKEIADVYNHGSVVESSLIGWLKDAFEAHGNNLRDVVGSVAHTGEGEWTANTAKELSVKAKVIGESVKVRIRSEKHPSFTGKILSALREQFGGHAVTKKNEP
jgi:6-phosphogluconate dehydrogenase